MLRVALPEPQFLEADDAAWPQPMRRAAVMVLLRERGEVVVPMVVRGADAPTHAGQTALPGGTWAPGDASLIATAIRETEEEIGIAARDLRVLGELGDLPTRTGFLVRPVVAELAGGDYRPDPREVTEVFEVPLAVFRGAPVEHLGVREVGRVTYPLNAYGWEGRRIWGMAARILEIVAAATLLVACKTHGGDGPPPDGAIPPDADADGCDHREIDDVMNEGNGEATGLVVGDGGVKICGQLDVKPPAPATFDTDAYTFTTAAAGEYMIRIQAPDAASIDDMVMYVDTDFGRGVIARGTHGAFLAELPAGASKVVLRGENGTEIAAPISYQITIAPDPLEARCAARTGTADTTESTDGVDNLGNDMVTLHLLDLEQTASPDDAPQLVFPAIAPGDARMIVGDSGASANAYSDDYVDRDTFLVNTSADLAELTVRVDWDDAAGTADDANLDLFWFEVPPDGTTPPLIDTSAQDFTHVVGPEFFATEIEPSGSYWLWVGNTKATGNPKPYAVTICGARPQ